MAKLIDVSGWDKFYKEMTEDLDCCDHYDQGYRNAAGHVNDWMDAQPTIEVEPVRHGRWVGLEYDGYADGFPVYDLWECSECGEEVRGEDVPDTHPYCHGCGAKMDGDEHEA